MDDKQLERDMAEAVDGALGKPLSFPGRKPAPLRMEVIDRTSGAVEETAETRDAAEQLAMATTGLMKVERDLIALHDDLVGPLGGEDYGDDKRDRLGSIFDRIRADARSLAELAIRIDRLVKHTRERL